MNTNRTINGIIRGTLNGTFHIYGLNFIGEKLRDRCGTAESVECYIYSAGKLTGTRIDDRDEGPQRVLEHRRSRETPTRSPVPARIHITAFNGPSPLSKAKGLFSLTSGRETNP